MSIPKRVPWILEHLPDTMADDILNEDEMEEFREWRKQLIFQEFEGHVAILNAKRREFARWLVTHGRISG